MNNLPLPSFGNQPSRGLQRAMHGVVEQTRLAGMQLDSIAALAGRTMDRSTDLYDYGTLLAGDDPTKKAIVMQVEMQFIAAATSHLSNHAQKFNF